MPKKKRNYHLLMSRVAASPSLWKCDYCDQKGSMEELQKTDCPHVTPPCEHCGGCEESNECKADCSSVAAILASPDVYLSGWEDNGRVEDDSPWVPPAGGGGSFK